MDYEVSLASGRLSGTVVGEGRVRVFRGVPYAESPIGDLRWRPPRQLARWRGTRNAKSFGPCCVQRPRPVRSVMHFGVEPASEDCLYLNVWAPADGGEAPSPVMFWIHGGGFYYGSGSLPLYDGVALAKKGVVVVTINYRLGPLGFLAHPALSKESEHKVSGNYGLLDQIAALEWVRDNIAAFGGDPQRVTIFGQSVGSSSVNCLMASPLARGLFHRAIAQSGGSMGPLGSPAAGSMQTLAQAEEEGLAFARRMNAPTIDDLRALPAEAVQFLGCTADAPEPEVADAMRTTRKSGWVIVDGHAVPRSVYATFDTGQQADVPLLAGWNSHEGSTSPGCASLQALEQECWTLFGDATERLLKLYDTGLGADAGDIRRAITGHRTFDWQNWTAVRRHAATARAASFCYHFERVPPFPPGPAFAENTAAKLGAFHTAEIPYVFDHLDVRDWLWMPQDRQLADMMSRYWVNFATRGDPNGAGLPQWPVFDQRTQAVMTFGDVTAIDGPPNRDKLDFWDSCFQSVRVRTG